MTKWEERQKEKKRKERAALLRRIGRLKKRVPGEYQPDLGKLLDGYHPLTQEVLLEHLLEQSEPCQFLPKQ